jgi:hypothetical protein
MPNVPKKRVIRHGVQIGEASPRVEVIAALVASGIDPAGAVAEVRTLCIEGRDVFEIVAPASQEKIIAETRRIFATRNG